MGIQYFNRGGTPASTTQNIGCSSIMMPSKKGKTKNLIFYSLNNTLQNKIQNLSKSLGISICDTFKGNESHVSNIQYLIFQYKSLVHEKCYILIQTPSQSDVWLLRCEHSLKFKNNVRHKNLLPLQACNSIKINIPNIRLIPLIMSHKQN